MGRRLISNGGGQSSLGYLFGGEDTASSSQVAQNHDQKGNGEQSPKSAAPQPINKDTPAGIHGNLTNNYFRAHGQNCGNFITDRPTTKVHAAPGGGSSLGYLFGGTSEK